MKKHLKSYDAEDQKKNDQDDAEFDIIIQDAEEQ